MNIDKIKAKKRNKKTVVKYIKIGDKTKNQFHVICPVSLSPMKRTVKRINRIFT